MDVADVKSAGDFSSWLVDMRAALLGEGDAVVPCDRCTACCTSSLFIHIEPDEVDTLAHIPRALLFPAPRRPAGHVVLGHDERGHCPMFLDGACSIYEHRPRTCRTFDCRIFAATGLEGTDGDDRRALIAQRVQRWHFAHPTRRDAADHRAVLGAAAAIRHEHPDLTATAVAMRAVSPSG